MKIAMKTIKYVFRIFLAGLFVLNIFSCKEKLNTNLQLEKNSKTIMVYLRDNPSYSILVEALEKTKLDKALNLYGTMTIFVPTNAAFEKFFLRRNISGISDMDTAELKKIIFYHLYDKTYGSSYFTTGSLGSTTVEGDFIAIDISQGVKHAKLNKIANIDSLDIPVINGIVHVIDDVLEPPELTLYEWLKGQPQYSIMLEAFEKTGNDTAILNKMVYDPNVLNFGKPSVKWRTVFLEPNSVLANKGINSFDDLARKYSETTFNTTKDYSNPSDPLNIFVRYHAMQRKFFLSDFKDDYYETFSKGNFLIFSTKPALSINSWRIKKTPYYNPGVENGRWDTTYSSIPNVTLVSAYSNVVARNGIVHCIDSILTKYTPPAVLLRIRFAGEPEDRMITLPDGSVANINTNIYAWKDDPVKQACVWWMKWDGGMNSGSIITGEWPFADVFADYGLLINNNSSAYSIELTTKPVFPGTYAVWYKIRRNSQATIQWYWDGEKMGGLIDITSSTDAYGHGVCGTDCPSQRQLGIVKLTTMASHKIKLYSTLPGTNTTAWYCYELRPL